MTIDVRVPQLPESVADATLVAWHKKPGDAVARDAYRELGERSESAAALERNRRLIARFGY